ncbi:2-C-methyl-D-erythritol 4-phosphate cytidylyltransferase [Lacrimispora sp. NSJ-141]|uniref:2-C-methyl-D-erythritol 4-phosphate cytidylyltransferase n=1 Tax=Lientehia hominis TaxID=2897778 RepID=A0AAP2RKZ6_9FIRM|nr:2-C-methyl-D-erythritol 4-phosphate cytidylyltransferase [Lientehia hominis]MCD2493731.1 2-C-methyl-D-erythritol 4-phosphate cytidylyltransferase [Lientehia hominis]
MGYEKVTAIILAAGQGKRMGTDVPKQYLKIRGHEVLYYSLKAFEESCVDEIILVAGEQDMEYCQRQIVERYGFRKVAKIIPGGQERYDSVYAGLLAADDCSYVLIHDGARPMVTPEIISRVLDGAMTYDSCTTGMPVKDTIKIADEDGMAVDTPERGSLWTIHTPQGFSYPVILEAHRRFRQGSYRIPVTDDTMLAEIFLRKRAKLVEGDYRNIKVTTPEDIAAAEAFLTEQTVRGNMPAGV